MAVSGLEQRDIPLIDAMSVWRPWGPLFSRPVEDEDLRVLRRRSRSWSNYSSYPDANQQGRPLLPESLDHSCQAEEKPAAGADWHKGVGNRRCSEVAQSVSSTAASNEDSQKRSYLYTESLESIPAYVDEDGEDSDFEPEYILEDLEEEDDVNAETALFHLSESEDKLPTTMMIRNLPYALKQKEILDGLDETGFRDTYDFCYLPYNFKSHNNRGYAFVNFCHPDVAAEFKVAWHKSRRFIRTSRHKPLDVSVAEVQGREANWLVASSAKVSRIKNSDFRPFVILPQIGASSESSSAN